MSPRHINEYRSCAYCAENIPIIGIIRADAEMIRVGMTIIINGSYAEHNFILLFFDIKGNISVHFSRIQKMTKITHILCVQV